MELILGIDPGISGGAVLLAKDKVFIETVVFSHITSTDVANWLIKATPDITIAYIEQVHSFPGQGVSSTFKFGQNFGLWIGFLTALKIPFQFVQPLKWQTAMSCKTGGDKNISKARAQELFPHLKITHANADALLIAEYGRRKEIGL